MRLISIELVLFSVDPIIQLGMVYTIEVYTADCEFLWLRWRHTHVISQTATFIQVLERGCTLRTFLKKP